MFHSDRLSQWNENAPSERDAEHFYSIEGDEMRLRVPLFSGGMFLRLAKLQSRSLMS